MKFKIYPYKMGSKSSKELATALECRRINSNRTSYRGYSNHIVINWGSQRTVEAYSRVHIVLNQPQAVSRASNKLSAFRAFTDASVPTLEYTTNFDEAEAWKESGHTVFARTTLSGHSGSGIVVVKDTMELVQAPLYTNNFEKDKEFRVHVLKDDLICIQQKRVKATENRDEGAEVDPDIWNHAGQRVFVRNSIDYGEVDKDEMVQIAIDAVKALGLDFGSVDIGTKGSEIIVFEVNTASGLTGSTIDDYKRAFNDYMDRL